MYTAKLVNVKTIQIGDLVKFNKHFFRVIEILGKGQTVFKLKCKSERINLRGKWIIEEIKLKDTDRLYIYEKGKYPDYRAC